jgi:hypothetical protein
VGFETHARRFSCDGLGNTLDGAFVRLTVVSKHAAAGFKRLTMRLKRLTEELKRVAERSNT